MILVSGGNGFVGTHLQNNLLQSGYPLHGLSLRNSQWEKEITSEAQAIIHLAGKAHDLKNTSNADEYYQVNTELTKKVFDAFLASKANVFITLSSVKAVADDVVGILTETHHPNPITHYGKSKLLAEEYILSKEIPKDKRVYILRPCMIHGPGNKGNLNLLYKLVSKGIPWPLGAFENQRSFCSIDNLVFIIKELLEREDVPSGVYNVADDTPISTNRMIHLIAASLNRKPLVWHIPKGIIRTTASLGDVLRLPLNSERLHKLTSSFVVSDKKIVHALGKPLPLSSEEGLLKTFKAFK